MGKREIIFACKWNDLN